MIKIVVDANVFLSGILSPGGAPAKLLELILADKVRLVISPQIIQEISRVIRYQKIIEFMQKRHITPAEVEAVILKILSVASITAGETSIARIAADPADDMFLACALEGQADFIVSGDHHLTDLQEFRGIKIISPTSCVILLSD